MKDLRNRFTERPIALSASLKLTERHGRWSFPIII